MLGHKSREFERQVAVSLEALVPPDNFYRQVDQCIDLSFVRDLAAEFYSSLGRPSIDPVVFFRLHLVAFAEKVGRFSCSCSQARNRIARKIDSHHYLM